MPQRKRGAQPGNQNAVKHGRTRKAYRQQRRAEALARWEAEQERSRAWIAAMPATDYGAICDTIRKSKPET